LTRGDTLSVQKWFYHVVAALSRGGASWIVAWMVGLVTSGFFIFFPRRVRISTRFYKALFPGRGRSFLLWCAWRQYHRFSQVFLDRLQIDDPSAVTVSSEGWEALEASCEEGKGGIILMSHLGNWEIAARLLKKRNPRMRLLLYMGVKQKEQIEAIQKEGLSEGGVEIVGIDQDGGSPLDIIEGIKVLRDGGFVSMTGDVSWNKGQRMLPVSFLGHRVMLPATPHILALLSGAPLFIFFAFCTGRRHYHFRIVGPKVVTASSRSERTAALLTSAQEYADLLEEAARHSPLEWYHFEDFLGQRLCGHRSGHQMKVTSLA
jgi:predicted LPLAT superfamily acyltransferase